MKAANKRRFFRIAIFVSVLMAFGIPVTDRVLSISEFRDLVTLFIQFILAFVAVIFWIICLRDRK